jgi:excisionase family DNA binding protein
MMANVREQEDRPILIMVSEAARLLNVSALAIYKMITTGRLDSYEIAGCTRKVDQRQIDAMLVAGYRPQANGRK